MSDIKVEHAGRVAYVSFPRRQGHRFHARLEDWLKQHMAAGARAGDVERALESEGFVRSVHDEYVVADDLRAREPVILLARCRECGCDRHTGKPADPRCENCGASMDPFAGPLG